MKDNLEQTLENSGKTEYRIITNRTHIGDRYLQFKSTKTKRNFPDVWNTREEEVWRYVPNDNLFVLGTVSEEDCPTSLPFLGEAYYQSSFHGHENFPFGLVPFTKNYPDIQVYFDKLNEKRAEYLEEQRAADNAQTQYL